jgi:uncharacterized protein DUF4326
MTIVVNCKTDNYDVLIDRTTMWGNPYRIGRDGTREEVIEIYEVFLRQSEYHLMRLPELVGKVLGCHCKPLPCHGDVIIKIMKEKGLI